MSMIYRTLMVCNIKLLRNLDYGYSIKKFAFFISITFLIPL